MPALHRQARQVEHEDAAGILRRDIVVDVGVIAVLDLDPRDILGRDRIADDDILRLADVNARVRCAAHIRSEEHTSELQSLMRISYAVFCMKKTKISPSNR